MRHRTALGRRKLLADSQHDLARIAAAAPLPPQVHLLREVGGGLPRQRRIAWSCAFATHAVAGGAGLYAARGITPVVQGGGALERRQAHGRRRKGGIVQGNGLLLAVGQPLGNPLHLRVLPPAVGIGAKLTLQVPGVEPGEPRRGGAVALAVQPMAGNACVPRARLCAAQRHQLAGGREAGGRGSRAVGAARGQQGDGKAGSSRGMGGGTHGHPTRRTVRAFRIARLALLLALVPACKAPPDERQEMPQADAARGKALVQRAGCGACHTIAGLDWPQGTVGPRIDGMRDRALIAGRLPNRPDLLAAFIRNAPALVPGSPMPPMPVSEDEARDIAAYLYSAKCG